MTKLERHKRAVAMLSEALRQYTHPDCTSVCEYWQRLTPSSPPAPQYEETEIVRWECDKCGKIFTHDIIAGIRCGALVNGAHEPVCDSTSYTRLVGTRRVEVKKVDRSAEVMFYAVSSTAYQHISGDTLPNHDFVANLTWQE